MTLVFRVILIVAIVFNSLALIFLAHLISFHIFLQKKGLSTFEYLQIKQKRINHKSKIFREVRHDEGSEIEQLQINKESILEEKSVVYANIDTENALQMH